MKHLPGKQIYKLSKVVRNFSSAADLKMWLKAHSFVQDKQEKQKVVKRALAARLSLPFTLHLY
jgi:hypothetical protein